jgi:hypothetical protein
MSLRRRPATAVAGVTALAVGAVLGVQALVHTGPATASAGAAPQAVPGPPAKVDRSTLTRTIITTDGENDDMNSFMRLLYYTDDLDIAGLVYTSSVHHWKGDGTHTLAQAKAAGIITSFNGETQHGPARSDDATQWRWYGDTWMEDMITKNYSQVYPNLVKHDPNYPTPAELWSKVAVGNVDFENDFSADTPGSDLIKADLLDDDTRPLYLEAWGGTNTIARALKSIEEQYKGTSQWAAVQAKVSKKAVINAIGQQDNAYADYIGKTWPTIKMLDFGSVFGGFTVFASLDAFGPADTSPAQLPYFRSTYWSQIKYGKGAVLDNYGLIGDGTYFPGEGDALGWQPGQAKDPSTYKFFDAFGTNFSRLDWTSEGDSPSFVALLPTGLRGLQDPTLGGWGGRLQPNTAIPGSYQGASDYNPFTKKQSGPYTIVRFMPAIGNDFLARAQWGVSPTFAGANHQPTVTTPVANFSGKAGQTVPVGILATDPDGNKLSTAWSVYTDASTVTGTPKLTSGAATSGGTYGSGALVQIPAAAKPGQRIVVVAAVSDNGTPSLTRYGQMVVTVK